MTRTCWNQRARKRAHSAHVTQADILRSTPAKSMPAQDGLADHSHPSIQPMTCLRIQEVCPKVGHHAEPAIAVGCVQTGVLQGSAFCALNSSQNVREMEPGVVRWVVEASLHQMRCDLDRTNRE